MITKPTVLILGAGSNVEYGFPTGDELRIEIIDGLGRSGTAQQGHFINSLNYEQDYLIEFANDFNQSSESIDRFLEKNTDYKRIGYQAIAYCLTRYEPPAQLSRTATSRQLYRTATPRWYDYLWRTLDEGHDDFINNKLSIITFNYDRSLEHYLAMALKRIHHFDDATIGEALAHLKFIHLYGTIGGRPFIDRDPVPFGDISRLQDSAATIKIIERSTDNTVSDAFKAAHAEISEAQYIFLLGFGFYWLNCERLAIREHFQRNQAKVFATALDMGERTRNDHRKRLELADNECVLHNGKCLDLFGNVQSLPTR